MHLDDMFLLMSNCQIGEISINLARGAKPSNGVQNVQILGPETLFLLIYDTAHWQCTCDMYLMGNIFFFANRFSKMLNARVNKERRHENER